MSGNCSRQIVSGDVSREELYWGVVRSRQAALPSPSPGLICLGAKWESVVISSRFSLQLC